MRKPRVKATKIRSSFLKLVRTFASWEPTCRTPFTQNGMKSIRLRASPLSHSSHSTPCRDSVAGAWRPGGQRAQPELAVPRKDARSKTSLGAACCAPTKRGSWAFSLGRGFLPDRRKADLEPLVGEL